MIGYKACLVKVLMSAKSVSYCFDKLVTVLMHEYEGNETFVADETVLYHSIPDKGLNKKQEVCKRKEKLRT